MYQATDTKLNADAIAMCARRHRKEWNMSEQNKTNMRRFYDEVFNAGNTNVVDELVAPDFVDHEEVPWSQRGARWT